MHTRTLSFADAVRLLEPEKSALAEKIGKLAGGVSAIVSVATLGQVDFFALRDEVVTWAREVDGSILRRVAGLGRFDRTQLLAAAHSVLVISTFFEAVAYRVPGLAGAQITQNEQVTLATREYAGGHYGDLLKLLVDTPLPMPSTWQPFEDYLKALAYDYQQMLVRLNAFLEGIQQRLNVSVTSGERIAQRYEERFRALALEVPEFALWAEMTDSAATRHLIRSGLHEITDLLQMMKTSVDPTVIRAELRSVYGAALTRPILATSRKPDGVVIPTLAQGYINPGIRIGVTDAGSEPAAEAWWKNKRSLDDVQELLLSLLTAPDAVRRPILILGQPGSGKSVLTRILAARLSGGDFLVVHVELRNVSADSSVYAQIGEAIGQTLGRRVDWPDLANQSGAALPLIIFDGFDELLQATGVNRSDFLERIEEFQEQQLVLGRPVAAIVTSRTVVAERARCPVGTFVLRLEPFSDAQVEAWLEVWNTLNAQEFHQRDVNPLPVPVALAQRDLARQPLLLLLLGLYDAASNALQNDYGRISHVELYERLFGDFAAREVEKETTSRSEDQRQAAIDDEWAQLSIAAAAMSLSRPGFRWWVGIDKVGFRCWLQAGRDGDLVWRENHRLGSVDHDMVTAGVGRSDADRPAVPRVL